MPLVIEVQHRFTAREEANRAQRDVVRFLRIPQIVRRALRFTAAAAVVDRRTHQALANERNLMLAGHVECRADIAAP